MSKISITSNPSGTGVFTISSPATNTNRTLTLPDETGTVLTSASTAPGGLKSIQVFTSSGTWTKASGVNLIKVYVTGAGGSGGGGGGSLDWGAGGGAGGTSIKVIDVSAVSTVSVTVGTGGSAVAGLSTTNGIAGGTSSFGAYCSGAGGAGGLMGNSGPVRGGRGGAGTGGDINLYGGRGNHGFDNSNTSSTWASGIAQGGASFWGGGGTGNYGGTNSPTDAPVNDVYGAGGGGAYYINALSGAGAVGIIIVEEYA